MSRETEALDAATLARCGYVPCWCPDDWRECTPASAARCPQHGGPEARARWFDGQREQTQRIVSAYVVALGEVEGQENNPEEEEA